MRPLIPSLALAILALLGPSGGLRAADPAPSVFETFDGKGIGGFRDVVNLGRDGAWITSIKDGVLTFSNDVSRSAVHYFFLPSLPGASPDAMNRATVEVDVSGRFDGSDSGAGILYGGRLDTGSYLVFALLGNDNYALLARGKAGVKPLAVRKSTAVLPGKVNHLSLVPNGDLVELRVNGTKVDSFKSKEAGLGSAVGIIAFGQGEFHFDNFKITRNDG